MIWVDIDFILGDVAGWWWYRHELPARRKTNATAKAVAKTTAKAGPGASRKMTTKKLRQKSLQEQKHCKY
jgi:hypothetical protein